MFLKKKIMSKEENDSRFAESGQEFCTKVNIRYPDNGGMLSKLSPTAQLSSVFMIT